MAELKLDPGMGPAVLRHLRQFANLPTDGLVAGQAVASAVSELFGEGWGVVYNDVDVFRHYRRLDETEEQRKRREKLRVLDTVRFTALDLEVEGWTPYSAMREVAITRREKYSVVKTMREGMLNVVYYDHGYASVDGQFLQTFDINAAQVGVDILSGQLMWTREYQRYLRTKQLEIVTMHTPYQSLIRYFKKRQELDGTYGNDARMTEMIALAYAMATTPADGYNPREDQSLRWRFGETIAEKLEGVRSFVEPDFEVLSEEVEGHKLYQLAPRFEVERDILKLVRRQGDIAHLLPRLSRTLREARRKAFVARAQYVTEPTIALDKPRENPRNLSQLIWLFQGDEALQSNVTVQQLKDLDDFVWRNDVSGYFMQRSLTNSLTVKARIEKAIQERGRWLYGALRTGDERYTAFEHEGWMEMFLERENARQAEHVIDTVLPERLFPDVNVVELHTRRLLLEEGEALHHCIGGYSHLLTEGSSRFFSIRPSAERRTWMSLHLELAGDPDEAEPVKWRCSQVRGMMNRNPSPEELEVVDRFITRFNEHYLMLAAGGWCFLVDEPVRWQIATTPTALLPSRYRALVFLERQVPLHAGVARFMREQVISRLAAAGRRVGTGLERIRGMLPSLNSAFEEEVQQEVLR